MPKISVVTISFNQAPFLERAFDSVLNQQGIELEYIVVDPGSTDGSRDIIQRYAPRLAHILLEPDRGPGDGLNNGLARATGDYFAYLNSDDEFLPGALHEAVAFLDTHPEIDVVYGCGWMVDADGRRLKHLVPSRRFSDTRYARGTGVIVQQSSVMRTAALRRAGGFNIANRSSWDGEAYFEMARRGSRFQRVMRDWSLFRVHDQSITNAGVSQRFLDDTARIFRTRFGRDPSLVDRGIRHASRIADMAAEPGVTFEKLRHRLGGGT